MNKRIVFTGGAGKAGRHVVPYLVDRGLRRAECRSRAARIPRRQHPRSRTLPTAAKCSMHCPVISVSKASRPGRDPAPIDAVVHFAAVPRVLIKPDNETFRINTIGTYNVIEAAVKLGIRKIIIASSETTYGVCFAEGDKDFHQFPLEEDYDIDPDGQLRSVQACERKDQRAPLPCGLEPISTRCGSAM